MKEAELIIRSLRDTIIQNGLSLGGTNIPQTVSINHDSAVEENGDECFVHLRLPMSNSDIRKILEARHSLMSNILTPPITFHCGGISWVKASDILKMSICLGVPFEVVIGPNYDKELLHARSIYRCPAIIKQISDSDIDDDVVTVIYGFWSDGCYCGTESKGIRNQAKVGTIHIAHHHVTERHVFPIYFGRKNDDDDEVKRELIRDMEELSESTIRCYIPSIREVRKVRFLLGYAIQDRIEHAETTCYMGPTGKCSRMTTLSCPISTDIGERNSPYSLCKSLRSCRICWNKRIESMSRGIYHEAYHPRRCRDCYDWNLSSVEYYVPANYPLDSVDINEVSTMHQNAIKTKTITFNTMKAACHQIFDKIKTGAWNQSVADVYARRECIRESVWKKVWRTAKDLSRSPEVVVQETTLDESSLPCFWNQNLLPLEGFHLGIMHYLFLNVGKHLFDMISLKTSESGSWLSVYHIWNTGLVTVRKLGLSWCKAWSLGSTEVPGSAWVAENYVGFSILCKSLSSALYLDDGAQEHIPNIQEVLETYYTLCAVVMSPIEPNERHHKYATCLAKCFLSVVTEYSLSIQRQRVNKIESTSCFINLLNIGDRMKDYGVMRNFWEGGYRGEGIFRPMKGLINRGLHCDKISLQTLRKQYKRLALNDLILMKEEEEGYVSLLEYELSHQPDNNEQLATEEEDFSDKLLTDNADRYRRFHCYRTIEEVNEGIDRKDAIALAQCISQNQFYIFIGQRKREKKVAQISFRDGEVIRGTHVSHIGVSDVLVPLQQVSLLDEDYISCLLLPLHYVNVNLNERDIDVKYFIVNEDHQERSADGSFCMPVVNLREKEESSVVGNIPNDEMMAAAYDICSDRNKCLEFIDRRVDPIGDLPFAKVTHFKYVRSIVTVDTSLWTIKYYTNEECTGNARKQEAIGYFQLMDRLMDE